jgi:hypothetical protein
MFEAVASHILLIESELSAWNVMSAHSCLLINSSFYQNVEQVSTNFFDIFSFGGPAPETINGRLAMLGFATALGVELFTGEDLATQIGLGGVQWFIVTAAIFTGASLIPMFKGVTVDSKSKPIFSSTAEKWNGRFAMVGLVALAVTEFVKGSPLV